jgi:hypothetical protein
VTERKNPQIPASEPDHSTTTRSEALRESLKARRPPEPDREFSTLVVRSEPAQIAYEDPGPTDVMHEVGCSCRHDLVWPEHAALALVQALAAGPPWPSPSVPAGGADGSGDVVDDESEREPRASASGESHDGGTEREE